MFKAMKKFALVLILSFAHFLMGQTSAQVKFASVDYEKVLKQMPEYAQAQQSLSELKAKYDQEATRGEEEFQNKFSEFLQGQKDFPENILVKRQAELGYRAEHTLAELAAKLAALDFFTVCNN